MSDTKAQRLAGALNDFLRTSPDVEAAAVVSFDGLAMASALPPGMDEDRVGAMSAALLSLGEQAAVGLGRGEMRQLFVEGDDGFVFLMSARDQAVLAAVTGRSAKIGFMIYEMRRSADAIGAVLADPVASQAVEAPAFAPAPAPAPAEILGAEDFLPPGVDDVPHVPGEPPASNGNGPVDAGLTPWSQ